MGVAVALTVLGWTAPVRAGGESLQKKVDELNSTTCKDAMEGQFKVLAVEPGAKKLIEFAQKLVKKDQKALTYNGALLLAKLARKKGNLEASEAFYRVCTKAAAELESTQKLLQSYGSLIELLYDKGKYKEAEKVCRELLELETGPGKARLVLVLFQLGPGQLQFVPLENYDSAKSLHAPVRRLMVQAMAKQGKFDEALKMAEDMISQKNHWLSQALHAWVLREAGRYPEAAKAYENILQQVLNDKNLDAQDRQEYEDQYRYILSNLYVETKQVNKAEEQLRALINRHPNEAGYYNDLGYILADHDLKLDEAEKLVLRALDLDRKSSGAEAKDNGAYLDSLGWVYYKQKKYKEAKDALQKAVADDRAQHIEIYDHLGDALLALGERESALKAWNKGAELAGPSRRDQERKTRVLQKIKINTNK